MLTILSFYYIFLNICVWEGIHEKLKDNLQGLILTFYHMGP